MPIYEYQCKDCGNRLEALQKIADAPLKECPSCHQQGLTKLVSASSFRLKGGGWYETDFKTNAKRHGTQDTPVQTTAPTNTAAPKAEKESKAPPAASTPSA